MTTELEGIGWPFRKTDAVPDTDSLIDRITPETFDRWYRDEEFRENIRAGTPYFNGPSPLRDATYHSPSGLLQCHRRITYRQLNAPEESANAEGILWFGTQFEEQVVMPYLQKVVSGPYSITANTLWIDSEIRTEQGELRIRGATDPVIVDPDNEPLLVTEIKTKSNISDLDSPDRHHRAQVHAYMFGLSEQAEHQITDAVIIYGSRSQMDIKPFHIEFDPHFWKETVIDWASTHTEYRLQDKLPPANPEFDWECEFCPYSTRCGQANTAHSDVGPTGFLPLYTDYPQEKVEEYLQAHEDAKLTPALAQQYPELAENHDVFDWHCSECEKTYEWDDVEWNLNKHDPPICPSCATEDTLAPLRGPSPEQQHQLAQPSNDHYEPD